MLPRVLVLIANTSYAQVFEIKGHGNQIKKIHQFEFPDGRKKPGEIYSDRPGRSFDRFGDARHALSEHVDIRETQQQEFAHIINEYLKKEKDNNSFDELVLIAPGPFLGNLQKVFDDGMKKLVTKELDKDLPQYLKEQEVIEHLCRYLDLWNHQP